jgi:hypothetical protein
MAKLDEFPNKPGRLLKNPSSKETKSTRPQAYWLYVEDLVDFVDAARRGISTACN